MSGQPKLKPTEAWMTELEQKDLRMVCWGSMPSAREQKAMSERILKNSYLSPKGTVTFIPVTEKDVSKAKDHRSKRGGVEGG